MRTRLFLIGTLLLVSNVATAAETKAGTSEATAAFARLKTLVGEWEAESDMGKARVTYELIAHGTALVERESIEKMSDMLTIYHLDGDRLILTHYCMAGNQPRMQVRAFNAATGELRFEFLDATGLPNPKAGHMRNATIQVGSDNRLAQAWEFYENGQLKKTHSITYTRLR
jgi:hypothetical protein